MKVTSARQTSPLDRLHEDFGWTPRQREVLDLLAQRRTNGEIATALGISLDGAKWHVGEVMTKLGTNSRDEAAEYWRAYNRMPLRFSRAMRALAAALSLRRALLAVGGLAVAGVAVLAIFVVANLGNDDGSQPADDGTPCDTITTNALIVPGDNRQWLVPPIGLNRRLGLGACIRRRAFCSSRPAVQVLRKLLQRPRQGRRFGRYERQSNSGLSRLHRSLFPSRSLAAKPYSGQRMALCLLL